VPTDSYRTLSGTSMAAPHVAGAWAVMRQRYPTKTVSEILGLLRATGQPISITATSIPRIQLDAALGLGSTPTATSTPIATPTEGQDHDVDLPIVVR
jgi:subtilisin family serine protease